MSPQDSRTLVVMPTYNESATLPTTLERLREHVPWSDVLVVDDASPDGTGDLADTLARDDAHVHVLHRAGKEGLGPAYVAGFTWALERDYEIVVEMDADGSHRAMDLPKILTMLDAYPDAALVLGSRWIAGGRVENWATSRKLLSRAGNSFVHTALGLPLGDATGGFRAYRSTALRALDLGSIASQGYCFQVDMAWRVYQTGAKVIEVPITFVEREAGESKMTKGIVREAFVSVSMWGAKHRAQQARDLVGKGWRATRVALREARGPRR